MIKIEKVNYGYDINNPIIKDIDLNIKMGECIGIVGPNGVGKSTLLKLLTGLHYPDSGQIIINGIELKKKNIKEIRSHIGYLFQDPDNQLFMPTVFEDIAFSLRNSGVEENEIEKIAIESLRRVHAEHLLHRVPYKLSGGEKRIAAIATILAMTPEIIIFDEPAVGLDPKSRRSLIKLLNELTETKIIATHDMDMALDLCDRVIILKDGNVYRDDEPIVLFSDVEALENCNLEQPLVLQSCPLCNSWKKEII